jgi:hypothetical protein
MTLSNTMGMLWRVDDIIARRTIYWWLFDTNLKISVENLQDIISNGFPAGLVFASHSHKSLKTSVWFI